MQVVSYAIVNAGSQLNAFKLICREKISLLLACLSPDISWIASSGSPEPVPLWEVDFGQVSHHECTSSGKFPNVPFP